VLRKEVQQFQSVLLSIKNGVDLFLSI